MALGRTADCEAQGGRPARSWESGQAQACPTPEARGPPWPTLRPVSEDRLGADARVEGRGGVYQRSRPRWLVPARLPGSSVIYFPV